jgi:predicted permease
VLRVEALLGRTLLPADAGGDATAVVLSHGSWKNHFGGDPGVVGRDVLLDDEPRRVVGVMPPGFGFPHREVDVWVPFVITPGNSADTERGREYSNTVGRLKPGATIEQLEQQLAAIISANAERFAASGDERAQQFAEFLEAGYFKGKATALRELWVGELRPAAMLLQGAVLVVLLIACANVANLSLTQLTRREREIAVRAAVGAGRWRIGRQLVVESLLLATVGGLLGMALAWMGVRYMSVIGLDRAERGLLPEADATVWAFAAGSALLAGLLASVLPLVRLGSGARFDALKEGGRSGGSGKATLAVRHGLTILQVSLATALVFGAGLLIQSFERLQSEDPGFDPGGVVTAGIELPLSRYPDREAREVFWDRLIERIRAMPGVRSAAWGSLVPFSGNTSQASYVVEGSAGTGQTNPHGHTRVVGPDYFETLELPVLRGRTFTAADRGDTEAVVIIDRRLAERHFPGEDPVGRRIGWERAEGTLWWRIVGVVGTAKHASLSESMDKETYYLPLAQHMRPAMNLFVRSDLPPRIVSDRVREVLGDIDDQIPLASVRTIEHDIDMSLSERRAPMVLLVAFGAAAVALAAIGVFSVMAFTVSQRTGEVGLRMALGAGAREVAALIMRRAGALTLWGLAVGVALAAGLGHWLRGQLYGVSPLDPLMLAAAVAVLALVAGAAAWLPLRRALNIQPTEALRYE